MKPTEKLSREQKEILVGLLLGDGCLETQTKGRSWRLLIEQSLQRKEYVDHLYEIFKHFVQTPPKVKGKAPSLPGGKRSFNQAFKTTVQSSFRFYGHQFYKIEKKDSFRKRVPKGIGKLLTPKGLAYWYMDDGSMKSKVHKAVYLNTQGFFKEDVDLLCEVLRKKFDLECKPKKSERDGKVSYQIAFSGGTTFDKLEALIRPYLHPSMISKFPPSRKKR
jgi:hypothetical protein